MMDVRGVMLDILDVGKPVDGRSHVLFRISNVPAYTLEAGVTYAGKHDIVETPQDVAVSQTSVEAFYDKYKFHETSVPQSVGTDPVKVAAWMAGHGIIQQAVEGIHAKVMPARLAVSNKPAKAGIPLSWFGVALMLLALVAFSCVFSPLPLIVGMCGLNAMHQRSRGPITWSRSRRSWVQRIRSKSNRVRISKSGKILDQRPPFTLRTFWNNVRHWFKFHHRGKRIARALPVIAVVVVLAVLSASGLPFLGIIGIAYTPGADFDLSTIGGPLTPYLVGDTCVSGANRGTADIPWDGGSGGDFTISDGGELYFSSITCTFTRILSVAAASEGRLVADATLDITFTTGGVASFSLGYYYYIYLRKVLETIPADAYYMVSGSGCTTIVINSMFTGTGANGIYFFGLGNSSIWMESSRASWASGTPAWNHTVFTGTGGEVTLVDCLFVSNSTSATRAFWSQGCSGAWKLCGTTTWQNLTVDVTDLTVNQYMPTLAEGIYVEDYAKATINVTGGNFLAETVPRYATVGKGGIKSGGLVHRKRTTGYTDGRCVIISALENYNYVYLLAQSVDFLNDTTGHDYQVTYYSDANQAEVGDNSAYVFSASAIGYYDPNSPRTTSYAITAGNTYATGVGVNIVLSPLPSGGRTLVETQATGG